MVERLEVELRWLADGADDLIEALVGPDRRALVGDAGQLQHQPLERRFLIGKLGFERGSARARFLRLAAELCLLLRRRILEPSAHRIALGAQAVDFGLRRANLAVEREQRIEIEVHALVRGSRARPSRGSP